MSLACSFQISPRISGRRNSRKDVKAAGLAQGFYRGSIAICHLGWGVNYSYSTGTAFRKEKYCKKYFKRKFTLLSFLVGSRPKKPGKRLSNSKLTWQYDTKIHPGTFPTVTLHAGCKLSYRQLRWLPSAEKSMNIVRAAY